MQVSRLPIDPGPAAWNALLPDAPAAQELTGAQTAEWLVIGAGFAGLAAARRLRQLDPTGRIVVLEAARVASGPAGRNSGFMIDLPHDLTSADYGGALEADKAQITANRHAIKFAADMAREFALPAEAFDHSGKINAAASSRGMAHNAGYADHLTALGEAFELYDAAQMQEITGSHYYEGGLYTPGSAILQPAMFVRGIAGGLFRQGVEIYENSPVIGLTRPGPKETGRKNMGDWVAKTPKGQVTAPRVILAVNGHLNSFGHYQGRLMHVFTYASMTRALNEAEAARVPGRPNWGATPADPMGTTVRRISGTGGARFVIRNRFTFEPGLEISDSRLAKICAEHDQGLVARYPQLAGVSMEFRWGGRLCLARNDATIVEELEPGLYSACCQNGLGTARGTLGGIQAAELATGAAPQIGVAPLKPNRVPPLTRFAAPVYLRWMERQAGREK